ncbi:MAG: hypothetical protein AAGG68_11695 [Bacteroidota bacterium]
MTVSYSLSAALPLKVNTTAKHLFGLGVALVGLGNYATRQLEVFASNIMNNTPVAASGEEGLIDLQIIDTIKKSAEVDGVVDVDYN